MLNLGEGGGTEYPNSFFGYSSVSLLLFKKGVSQFDEKYMGEQISNLSLLQTEFGTVNFNMELTMIDGKVYLFEVIFF